MVESQQQLLGTVVVVAGIFCNQPHPWLDLSAPCKKDHFMPSFFHFSIWLVLYWPPSFTNVRNYFLATGNLLIGPRCKEKSAKLPHTVKSTKIGQLTEIRIMIPVKLKNQLASTRNYQSFDVMVSADPHQPLNASNVVVFFYGLVKYPLQCHLTH